MPPSADAFPGRAERTEPTSSLSAAGVPTPRPAPESESAPPEAVPAYAEPRTVPSEPDAARTEPDASTTPAGVGLTEREQRILAFERHWWRHAGAKEQAIRDSFGLSATRYYQLLNALLDNPAALAAEPLLIGRLRRLRSSRARNRRR